jgi:hypothetical protein
MCGGYGFVATRTEYGLPLRILMLVDKLLKGEIVTSLLEVQILIEN